MTEINPMPLLLIRAHILTALKNNAYYNISELVTLVHGRIVDYDSEMASSIAESRLYQVILDMVESGSLRLSEGSVSRNPDHVKNMEDPHYTPYDLMTTNDFTETVNYDGSTLILTANTEDYTDNYHFLGLNEGDYIEVELLPEPNNAYDKGAVCIIRQGKVLGYLDRTSAKGYQPLFLRDNNNAKKVVCNAMVKTSPYIAGIYYLDIRLR
jgi:hypothetical protein